MIEQWWTSETPNQDPQNPKEDPKSKILNPEPSTKITKNLIPTVDPKPNSRNPKPWATIGELKSLGKTKKTKKSKGNTRMTAQKAREKPKKPKKPKFSQTIGSNVKHWSL